MALLPCKISVQENTNTSQSRDWYEIQACFQSCHRNGVGLLIKRIKKTQWWISFIQLSGAGSCQFPLNPVKVMKLQVKSIKATVFIKKWDKREWLSIWLWGELKLGRDVLSCLDGFFLGWWVFLVNFFNTILPSLLPIQAHGIYLQCDNSNRGN